MAPSKESQALAELFRKLSKAFPADNDPFLSRCIYDQVHTAATEPTGVTYESVVAGERPALWIRPHAASSKHVMLFMHGGGYSNGSVNGHRKLAAHLAKACNCTALSIDYRLTPEYPYPTPLNDCVAAYEWLLAQGFSSNHIVTAGDSCGGGLATAVPLATIQRGLPLPGAAISLSPWYDMVDLVGTGTSLVTNADKDEISSIAGLKNFAKWYTANGASVEDPLISPLRADPKGLPPHWISCPDHDVLRDQGITFAEKAKKAGVEVVLEVHEGQQHVFEFMAGKAPEADESLRRIGEWVRQIVGA